MHEWTVPGFCQNPNWSSFQDRFRHFTCFRTGLVVNSKATSWFSSESHVKLFHITGIRWSWTSYKRMCILLFLWGVRLGRLNTTVIVYWECILARGSRTFPVDASPSSRQDFSGLLRALNAPYWTSFVSYGPVATFRLSSMCMMTASAVSAGCSCVFCN